MRTKEEAANEYKRWLTSATADTDLIPELEAAGEEGSFAAFAKDLAFGTAGLRGVIGAGTDRMNVYTVARSSRGLSAWVNKNSSVRRVAIGYDSRIKSRLFAETAAAVFADCGLEVYIWPRLLPVPAVSYATRELGCAAGVMITASHNPSEYNGYKVYGPDGCQLTGSASAEVLEEVEQLDCLSSASGKSFADFMAEGRIKYIPDSLLTAFVEKIKTLSVLPGDYKLDKNIAIVYSPLHGAGLEPVTRVLSESGFTNITVVEEQREPDGNFTTCPYPNPEIREALALGLEYAERLGADLMLATDPDCDRVGIAVRDGKAYRLLSGNNVGVLLLDYICGRLAEQGKLPADAMFVKTVVTTDLAKKVGESYGVRCVEVLTGFKYIGEQIALLEKAGRKDAYLFGFEESYGYLSGTHARDKDGVNAAFLICEMFAYWESRGVSLIDRLNELYARFGYCLNAQQSYYFKGLEGPSKMSSIMSGLREGLSFIGKYRITAVKDFLPGIDGLPATDMLKFTLEGDSSVMFRPSGTEPKLKAYFTVNAADEASASAMYAELCEAVAGIMK